VEIVSAIVGLASGLFGFLGADRKASAAENIARERKQAQLAWFDALTQGWRDWANIAEIKALTGRDVANEEADVQRTRIFYNYQALAATQGTLVAAVGRG